MGNLCELNRYQIYREVKLHSSLQHENIITLFGAFQQGDQVWVRQQIMRMTRSDETLQHPLVFPYFCS